MTHDLMPANALLNSARFIAMRGEPGWHALGITKAPGETMTTEEAIREIGIDFPFVSVPVGYTTPDGLFVEDGDRNVVLRGPIADDPASTWTPVGVVSKDYRYLQNIDLARGLDAIAAQTGWAFETAGALGKGETIFLTLRTGQASIFGDNVETFLAVTDGKAAARALQISVAVVRIVCRNTLLAHDEAATLKITIAHDDAVAGEYGFWLGLIGQMQAAQDATLRQLTQMASVKISDAQAKKLIAAAYPLDTTSARQRQAEQLRALPDLTAEARALVDAKVAKLDETEAQHRRFWTLRREAAYTLYERFNAGQEHGVVSGGQVVDPETMQQISHTPYAVLQAVTELADWGGRANDQTAAASAFFGQQADTKKRVWKAALALASK